MVDSFSGTLDMLPIAAWVPRAFSRGWIGYTIRPC